MVAVLRRLGFTVVDAAVTAPAAPAAATAVAVATEASGEGDAGRRSAQEYGTFEAAIAELRMRSTARGPSLYQPILLLWAIGRARHGEPRLTPWSTVEREVGRLLSRHGARGERPRPDYPSADLHSAGLWVMHDHPGTAPSAHGDSTVAQWFRNHQPRTGLSPAVYATMRDSGPDRARCVHILLAYFDGVSADTLHALLTDVGLGDEAFPSSPPGPSPLPGQSPHPAASTRASDGEQDAIPRDVLIAARYERLCQLVEHDEPARHGQRVPRQSEQPLRSRRAREAALLRSHGRCENPRCSGQPQDVTDRGQPILEVDHVQELAAGGRDHPAQMVALCPNCHAIKTRGSTRESLRAELAAVAERRHHGIRAGAVGA